MMPGTKSIVNSTRNKTTRRPRTRKLRPYAIAVVITMLTNVPTSVSPILTSSACVTTPL
jgi:hypothetical protein